METISGLCCDVICVLEHISKVTCLEVGLTNGFHCLCTLLAPRSPDFLGTALLSHLDFLKKVFSCQNESVAHLLSIAE